MRAITKPDASHGKKKNVNSYNGKSWLFMASNKYDQLSPFRVCLKAAIQIMPKICVQYFIYITKYIIITYTSKQNTVCIIVSMLLIFQHIFYFPTGSHPNSLQSMEKLPLISKDFGRDPEKLVYNTVISYLRFVLLLVLFAFLSL